jgi:hypothetical protein
MDEVRTGPRSPDQGGPVRQTAGAAAEAAGTVANTAKEQTQQVMGEVKTQTRSVAMDVRDKVAEQARTQNDKLADGIRRMADELDKMSSDRADSPARTVVARIAGGGRQVADYLADHGPDGVLAEVQDFARRRPGAFLATALVSGFVVGRLGRGVLGAASESSAGPPSTMARTPLTSPSARVGVAETTVPLPADVLNPTEPVTTTEALGATEPITRGRP